MRKSTKVCHLVFFYKDALYKFTTIMWRDNKNAPISTVTWRVTKSYFMLAPPTAPMSSHFAKLRDQTTFGKLLKKYTHNMC